MTTTAGAHVHVPATHGAYRRGERLCLARCAEGYLRAAQHTRARVEEDEEFTRRHIYINKETKPMLGVVPALSWYGEVSLGVYESSSSYTHTHTHIHTNTTADGPQRLTLARTALLQQQRTTFRKVVRTSARSPGPSYTRWCRGLFQWCRS